MFLLFCHHKKKTELEGTLQTLNQELKFTDDPKTPQIKGIFILGGDGTIFYALSRLEGEVPIIYSFNCGSYGFLSLFKISEIGDVIKKIKEGFEFKQISRRRLEISGIGCALNDVLITNKKNGRLNKFKIKIDGREIGEINCDSVLISTSSGSSSYNYSSGGPLLMPSSCSFIINCINPFRTHFRPIVLDSSSSVEIYALENLHENSETVCIVDGIKEFLGKSHFSIKVSKSVLKFASLNSKEEVFKENIKKLYRLN